MKRPFGNWEVQRLWEDAKYERKDTLHVRRETILDFVALYQKVKDERDAALDKLAKTKKPA